MPSEPQAYPSHAELLSWATDLGIVMGNLIPTHEDELRVLQLLYSYRHLNGTNLDSLPSTDLIVHRVRLTPGTLPYSAKGQIRWPPHKEWWLRKIVQDGMMGGIYERTQHANGKLSAWNAQAVIVDKTEDPKPTDEPRITFNYSNVKEDMPGSHMELSSKVHDYLSDPRHKTFFQADIKHGYFSVILHPEDRHVFAFTIPGIGQLQPTRMPQGSRTAGHTMSELMNITLGPIPGPSPEPSLLHNDLDGPPQLAFYMDDIFSGHIDFESQFSFLKDHFLPRIEWARLTLSFKKLRLFVDHITALGVDHYIGGKIFIREARIANIAQWPIPKDATGVRSFLGGVGITRRWVKNFAEIARPLSRLTGGHPWQWTESELLSFEILRIKCATRVAVHGIDWSLVIHLYTDASGYAGGLVITQYQLVDGNPRPVEVPIIYDSFTFSVAERKYHTYKRELCAMVKFASKYYYLLQNPNQEAIIHTDHKPLVHFLESSLHDGIYGHWAAKLRELYIKIMHIKGKRNTVADGLSRTIFHREDCLADDTVQSIRDHLDRGGSKWVWKDGKDGFDAFLKSLSESEKTEVIENGSLHSLPVFALEGSASWDTDYLRSEWFGQTYQYLYTGNLPGDLSAPFLRKCLDYRLDEQARLWVTRRGLNLLCVPETKVAAVLQEAHDHSGHWGKENTILKLRGLVYWPSQSTDVEKYIQGCLSCARHYPAQRSQLLHPIVTHRPFQLMAMDFIGPLQRSTPAGQKYILHIMDYFSRYSVTYPSQTADAPDVIKALDDLFHRFPKPDAFYIDRGQHFENQLVEGYFKEQGILLKFGPSGASKAFGLIERGNRILEDVLRRTASSSRAWVETLAKATQEVNTRTILHLHHSPTQILFGILPKSPLTRIARGDQLSEANLLAWVSSIEDPNDHSRKVKEHLQQLITLQKDVETSSEHGKAKMEERYNRGVTLRQLEVGMLVLLHQKEGNKLEPRWRGPFMISNAGDHTSFSLKQLNGRRVKRTYHGDDLRQFIPREGHLALPDEPEYPLLQNLRRTRNTASRPAN